MNLVNDEIVIAIVKEHAPALKLGHMIKECDMSISVDSKPKEIPG